MGGFINGITAFLFLICITTLLGQAQNYQHKSAQTDYNSNGPNARSFGSTLGAPFRYNQNAYDYKRFSTASPNDPPYGQYNHHNHNNNHHWNYGSPRWDNPNYRNSYNHYHPSFPSSSENYRNKYSTERTYNYRNPTPYTEKNNWAATQKHTTMQPTLGHPGQLSRKNDFNITSEEESIHRNNIKRKSEDYDTSKMVYPNETPNVKYLDPKNLSKNCSFGLCDSAMEYPTEKIQRIISKSKELRQYFEGINAHFKPNIFNRFGGDEESLCATMKHTHFPQSAVNADNIEKYLVNVGDYKQGIVLETCQNEGSSCKFAEAFPTGYTTTCEQRYSVQRLMTARKESDEVVFDNFRLPTCCVCKVTRDKT